MSTHRGGKQKRRYPNYLRKDAPIPADRAFRWALQESRHARSDYGPKGVEFEAQAFARIMQYLTALPTRLMRE